MSNVLATTSIVSKMALAIIKNNLGFSKNVNRDWEDEFTGNMDRGYAPGATINIRKPPQYTYRAGRVAEPQATVENTVPLTLSQGGNDIAFTSLERTLSVTRLEDKVMAAIAPVTNEIDRQGLALAHYATYNLVNPTGALPTTAALAIGAMTGMGQRLDEMAAPRDRGGRTVVANPAFNSALVQGFGGFFNNPSKISNQYNTGMLSDSFGFNSAMDQNVDVHTNGTQVVTGTAVAAGLSGASIACAALGGTITRGTIINFPGVFAVNPQSRVSTGQLANFVVTADALVGATSISISPAIVTSGAFQNVTASPTTAQPYVIQGAASTSYATNVAYHKDAFTLAMVPMFAPPSGKGNVSVSQRTEDGMTVKVTEYYDPKNDTMGMRFDVLFGWAATYPELSVKFYTTN